MGRRLGVSEEEDGSKGAGGLRAGEGGAEGLCACTAQSTSRARAGRSRPTGKGWGPAETLLRLADARLACAGKVRGLCVQHRLFGKRVEGTVQSLKRNRAWLTPGSDAPSSSRSACVRSPFSLVRATFAAHRWLAPLPSPATPADTTARHALAQAPTSSRLEPRTSPLVHRRRPRLTGGPAGEEGRTLHRGSHNGVARGASPGGLPLGLLSPGPARSPPLLSHISSAASCTRTSYARCTMCSF